MPKGQFQPPLTPVAFYFQNTMRHGISRLRAGGAGFSPLSLFAAGEQGAWYDPSDFSSMFQDSAGTTPVTTAGQPVGKILDKSGRGNHAIQATAVSRPTIQQDGSGYYYLNFDGVDDGLATAATIDFTATDKMTLCVGAYKGSDAAAASLCEFGPNVSITAGTFSIAAPDTAGTFAFAMDGSTLITYTPAGFAAPIAKVLTSSMDIAGAGAATELFPYINGVLSQSVLTGTTAGTGNFSNQTFYMGRRAGSSIPLTGRIYQLVLRGAATTNRGSLETFVGSRMGIVL